MPHITQVYHTCDLTPKGTCIRFVSACNGVGVALETRCHLGRTIKYDTVSKLSWSANVIHHGIVALIDGVLANEVVDWRGDGVNGSVPEAVPEEDCVVSAMLWLDE